jgi:PAS domain S-box-containing protein
MSSDRHRLSMDILVVDDVPSVLDLLSGLLKEAGYSVRAAKSGELALRSAFAIPPALTILDVRMHGMDGFEVCRRLKLDPRTADVPVIFISGLTDVADRVRGFEVGGVDFITKPVRRDEVLARVHSQMKLRQAMESINEINRTLEAQVAKRTADLIKQRNIAQNYLDIAGVALFALDCDGLISMMNKKGQTVFGVAEVDVLGKNWVDSFVPAPGREDARRRYGDFIANRNEQTEQFLLRIVNARLEDRIISCSTKLLIDESGNVAGTISSAEDVTDNLKVQDALRKSEEKYRSYVENAPDAIFITDFEGRCVDANPAACELLMYRKEELLNKAVAELVSHGDQLSLLELSRDASMGLERNLEIKLPRRKGGEFLASVKSVRLTDDRILWFCSDISDLRKAEFQAVARAKELDEALSQLHSLTAHMHDSVEQERLAIATDIHDQVGALLTGANLLLNQLSRTSPEMSKEGRELLGQACTIVGQALTSSRGVYAQLRPPMLDDLGLVNTMRWYLVDWEKKTGIRERHYLSALVSEPNESIRMDMFRILQELLTNVARHSGATKVSVRLHVGKNCLVLRVSDNGCGFDMKVNKAGFGLQGIRGRLKRYSGTLEIEHLSPGMGFTAKIPMVS